MDIIKLDLAKEEPDRATEAELRFQAAAISAVAAIAFAFASRFLFGAPLLSELVAQFIFAIAPIWLVEIAVGMLGPFAKHLAFLACTVLHLLALTGAGIGFLRAIARFGELRERLVFEAAFGALIFFTMGLLLFPILGAGVFGTRLPQGSLQATLWTLAGSAVFVGALHFTTSSGPAKAKIESGGARLSRRRLVRATGYAVLLVGLYDIGRQLLGPWLTRGSGRVGKGDGQFPNIENLALEITPTADFYEVSKNAFDPEVDGKNWRLEVTGLVESPFTLTYEEICSLPSVEQYATLCCISNEVGGDLIGNATWRGVRLRDLLERAGVKQGVVDLLLVASDDYTDSIPIERAMADGTLLAYEMNGAPLTKVHGFPLRLIVPNIYGMKNVKWIKRLEAIDYDFKGYWQRRGWNDRAEYKTMSRIDAPDSRVKGETTIAGIAFAGERGISRVEVSTDGGRTWEAAEIRAPLGQYTWVLWQRRWTPGGPGKHRVLVRATDGQGVTQTSQYAPPAPDGSSGYHAVTIAAD